MGNKKALLLIRIPTPFMVELAEAVAFENKGWELDVWFAKGMPHGRGAHWLCKVESKYVFCGEGNSQKDKLSLDSLINRNKYNVVITSLALHQKETFLFLRSINNQDIPLIFWSEALVPRCWLATKLKQISYKYLCKKLGFAAVLAIGYRAFEDWKKIINAPIFIYPYYQDLFGPSEKLRKNKPTHKEITFIFSGQIIERNNITEILHAAEILHKNGYSNRFRIVFFGKGHLESNVLETKRKLPDTCITLQNYMPASWEGRLQPLVKADVLLSPGIYSGWGLTIPEALSIGIPVISTYGIESARYYIRNGLNGFLLETYSESIANAMRFFIDHPDSLAEMKDICIKTAMLGDVKFGAIGLIRILEQLRL